LPAPRIGLQQARGLGEISGACFSPASRANCAANESDQRQDLAAALAQRRNGQRDAVQPVVQVLPESPRCDLRLQIAVRGRDEAHVDRTRLDAADALDLLRLDHAQQRRLQLGRHVADLVEEDRAAGRRLQSPPSPRSRP
jgi:hypothetical protein